MQTLQNRYSIVNTLGQGGFSKTYLALDQSMPDTSHCVIKELSPPNNNPETVEMAKTLFYREARTLKGLKHPQIPSLLAYFEEGEQFYLVQEYIEGTTLSEILALGQTFPEHEVIQILQDILEVLVFIHNKNIIHRDIKPSNLIRRYSDNKVVLIDFGAVKTMIGEAVKPDSNSAVSIIIGTPGYMPSEQGQGSPVCASDIYSLGLTIIQLLTGRTPQSLKKDQYQEFILSSEPSLTANPKLNEILTKMVLSSLKERYSSAYDVLDDLRKNQIISSFEVQNKTASPGSETNTSSTSSGANKTKIMSPDDKVKRKTPSNDSKTNIGKWLLIGLSAVIIGGVGIKMLSTSAKLSDNPNGQITRTQYKNDEAGISIQYPLDWTISDGKSKNNFTISPKTNPGLDGVTINIEPLSSSTISLDKYAQSVIDKLSKDEALKQSVAIWPMVLSQQEAKMVAYNQSIDGKKYQVKKVFTISDNKVYSVTSRVEQDNLTKNKDIVQDMVNSFKITSSTPK